MGDTGKCHHGLITFQLLLKDTAIYWELGAYGIGSCTHFGKRNICYQISYNNRHQFSPSAAKVKYIFIGNPANPSLCGCTEQQWMVKPCSGSHGVGSDDDTSYVGQGLVFEASSTFHSGNHQKMSGKGI